VPYSGHDHSLRWAASLRLVSLFLLVATAARAEPDAAFTVRAWTLEDGLPTSTVQDMAQTPDGYLWISTTGGLARFDGRRFEVFGPEQGLPTNRFQGMCVGADGALYASSEDGSIVRGAGERFSATPASAPYLHSLCALPDGSLLGNGAGFLWRIQRGVATRLGAVDIMPFVVVDGRGRVWLNAPGAAPARLENDRIVPLGPPGSAWDRWLVDPRNGEPFFVRSLGRDAELLDSRLDRRTLLPGGGEGRSRLIDRSGRLWSVLGSDLVFRDMRDGRVRMRLALGIAEPPRRLLQDQAGNVWVGTQTQGLIRISPSPLRLLRPEGKPSPYQILVPQQLTDQTIVVWDRMGYPWRVGDNALLPYSDHDAQWWLPGFQGSGRALYRFTAKKSPVPGEPLERGALELRGPDGRSVTCPLPAFRSFALVEDPALPATVYVFDEERLVRLSASPGLPSVTQLLPFPTTVRDLHFDRAGRLWIATVSGLWRFSPGDTVRFTQRDGLPTDHMRQIHEDRDGTLWIGTYGGGLVRCRDGHFATLGRRDGLLEEVVSVVLEDDYDNLWLGGNRGIQRLSRLHANDCLDRRRTGVDVVRYAAESGLNNPEGSGWPGLRTPDGRLWFPTFDGLAVVDPHFAKTLTGAPPTPRVEAVQAGDVAVPRTERGFVLAPDQRRLTIRYTGIDLSAPEQVRFRYRLEGVDRDWIDARSRTATYTNVPPGRHLFHLIAIGAGVTSPHSETVTIFVRPWFWETWPFLVGALLAAAFVLVAGGQWRLRQLNARAARLTRAVDERTQQLVEEKSRTEEALTTVEAQARRLEALDRARSRFFANVSHEFRTPLTLIQGPLQDLRAGLHGELRPDAREQVTVALDSAARLHRLVDQLLDAARAEAGELRLERRPGDLIAFLHGLARSFAPLAERKRIEFTRRLPEGEARTSFDPQALEKVFANLLGNAFKFTPAAGHVRLLGSRTNISGVTVLAVSVEDDGPGIPERDLPHVFERFYRAEHPSTHAQPGTGLGLALARDLVEQHGGVIQVDSAEGRGSIFTVRLPLVPPATTGEVAPDFAMHAATIAALADEIRVTDEPSLPSANEYVGCDDAPTVLIVEDHPDVRAYLGRHLGRRYRVIEAADGQQALKAMRERVPDLMVSDVAMPGMDGYALCRAVREDPELEFVPIVLLSAAAASENRVVGFESGADGYLSKPFEVPELLARVAQLLASRRRLRERVARAAAAAVVYGTDLPGEAPDEAAPAALPAPPAAAAPGAGAAPRVSAADAAFVRRLREVIESRMGEEDFDVDRLAEAMGMGRTLLFEKVGELTKRTPMELVFEHRLVRAAEMLGAGEGGVGEIAYAVGFRSVSHFTHRFRQRFDVSPSAWKRGERGASGGAHAGGAAGNASAAGGAETARPETSNA
jgi:signal transduction histidine kinase/CheY-like chemotaxis protein/ligand-binding sensor domain-containing protein/AraC-like DNA-binding protein